MGNNEIKRLYTFGCSFTSYKWPTWADFIGQSYEIYENWGAPGAGNYYITSKVYECHQMNKLTANDTVLIMLSSFTRFDYIAPNSEYVISGNIYSQGNIDKEFLSNYWSEEFGFHITWFSLNSLIHFLDKIGCRYKIMCGFNLAKKELDYFQFEGLTKPLLKNMNDFVVLNTPENNLKDYAELKNSIEKIEYYSFNNWGLDHHPTIKMHHDWVKDEMSEFYNDDMANHLEKWEKLIGATLDELKHNFSSILDKTKEMTDFKKALKND